MATDAAGLTRLKRSPATAGERTVSVSVIVPCFNEADGIASLVERLTFLERELALDHEVEFVLVDDGSTDRTFARLAEEIGERSGFRVVRHSQNQGIAAALLTGMRAARGDYLCTIDADCSYDPEQLLQMLPLAEAGADAVTASPYHPQGAVMHVAGWRLLLSKSASRLYRLLFRAKLHTYTSCFRVFRRAAVAGVELREAGFVGVTELLWRLDRRGCRIVECPAILTSRKFGQSKLRVLRVAWGHLRFWTRAAAERCFGRRSDIA